MLFCFHLIASDLICSEKNMEVLRVRLLLDLCPPFFVSFVNQDRQ